MGEIIKLSRENFDEAVAKVASVLSGGGVALIPTETVYGLFTLYGNQSGVKRIFEIKKRPIEKAIALTLSNPSDIGKYAYLEESKKRLLESLLPGPVTAVLEAAAGVHITAVSKEGTIGIRIPDYSFTLKVISSLSKPLLSTSANISGEEAPADFKKINASIIEKVDIAVGAGQSPLGVPSTVVDLRGEKPVVIREGAVSAEELGEVFKKFHEKGKN